MFQFFSGKPFGLRITDTALQAIELTGDRSHLTVNGLAETTLPPDVVHQGDILQKEILAEAIKALCPKAKPNPIHSSRCILALAENQSYEHIFYLPLGLPPEELKAQIAAQVKETIPLAPDQLIYQIKIDQAKSFQVVFVVAAARRLIQNYVEVIKQAGFKTHSIEPESISLLRNLPLSLTAQKAEMLLYIRPKAISWFLFFDRFIFDSNTIALPEKDTPFDLLWSDLRESLAFLKQVIDLDPERFIVAGEPQLAASLMAFLKSVIPSPIEVLGDSPIPVSALPVSDPFSFLPVAGAALKGLDIKSMAPDIDLLSLITAKD